MLYLTCTTITSEDLAHYRVSRAKDWVSVNCGTKVYDTSPCDLKFNFPDVKRTMSAATRLTVPISSDDDEIFYSILDEVRDPSELNEVLNVCTPLSLACMLDKADYVHALLRKGADVNYKSGELQQTAVHFAAKNESGRLKCLELLHEYGADLNAQDLDHVTALHLACTMENIDLFNFLMKNGANINLADLDLETPLVRAILAQNPYMIKSLIAAGCDVNFGDPMEYIIRADPPLMDCIQLMIKRGASLDKPTYLNTACASNNIEMMHILKSHGINVNAESDIFGFTSLHHACVSLRASHTVVELLLEWGANVDVGSGTLDTPLHYACQQCNLKKVLALFDYNADVNRKDSGQMTPLEAVLTTRFPDELKDDYFKLGKLLIAAGTQLSKDDVARFEREIPVTLSSRQTEREILEFLNSLKPYVDQPMMLKGLCRQKIRSCLGSKISSKILILPLPVFLKQFLSFGGVM